MLGSGHLQAAQNAESANTTLLQAANSNYNRTIIENAWLASFHWICYGCDRKHGQHSDKHMGLARYLVGLGEGLTADAWRDMEKKRQGGAYGNQVSDADMKAVLNLLYQIRTWANS